MLREVEEVRRDHEVLLGEWLPEVLLEVVRVQGVERHVVLLDVELLLEHQVLVDCREVLPG